MNFDETIRTAARIETFQAPARLERARHTRDATPAAHQRSRLAWQVGKWLNHAGRWLQGMPLVVEPPRSLGPIALSQMSARYIGNDDGEGRLEPSNLVLGERRLS